MEAIILAGGLGTRLKSEVSDVPKPMAPIGGRPFLEILLGTLQRKGFTRAIISVGHMHNVITEFFGDQFEGIELVYEIEDSPRGTGGAIASAISHVRNDHVYILNGDTFLDFDICTVERSWKENEVPIIVTKRVEDATRYGALAIDGSRITGLGEKKVSGPAVINAGCYIVPPKIRDRFPVAARFSFENDFLSRDIKENVYMASLCLGEFIDIGVPEDFRRAQHALARLTI